MVDQVFWWVFFALLAFAIWRAGMLPDGGIREHIILFLVLFTASLFISIPVRLVLHAIR